MNLHRNIPVVQRAVRRTPLLMRIRRWASRISPPGFGGVSLDDVFGNFFTHIRAAQLNVRSAAVTYNFLMAIPPTLLILFALVPFLPLGNVQEVILSAIPIVFTDPELAGSLRQVIEDFMTNEQGSVLSFSILLTAFFSSNGMMGLMRSFDQQSPVYKKRTALRRRWIAIKLTFMLLGTFLFTVAGMLIQNKYLKAYILRVWGGRFLIEYATPLAIVALVFLSICLIYKYGPSLTRRPRFVSPGSVMATVLCLVATVVFFYLVSNFIQYNKVYGSIGTVIAFMVWMYIITFIILLGFELNISILLAVHHRPVKPAEMPVLTEEKNTG